MQEVKPLTAEKIAKLRAGLDTWDHGLSVEAMNDIDDALDEIERMRALLRRIERGTCPVCWAVPRVIRATAATEHEPGCELAALLG